MAERVAAKADAAGAEKIVGDFRAIGMDSITINAQGILPLRSRLAAIDGLADGPAVAEYLRQSAARGENVLFYFLANADFKNSAMTIAYALQGGSTSPTVRTTSTWVDWPPPTTR